MSKHSGVVGLLFAVAGSIALSPVLAATPEPPVIVSPGRVKPGARLKAVEVLPDVPVSPQARNLFSTPIGLCGDQLVVASVEEGSRFPNRLTTVVRLGTPDNAGSWQWRRVVLEERTLPDITHTQPSVGIDSRQNVHIAYNMHNMPWQYVRSRTPCSIDDFEFRGTAMSDADLHVAFEQNRSPWGDPGSAAIPGNQITYPAFFNDRNGDLYVTYRFAVRPGRTWLERAFGGGIARFDVGSQRWSAVGGDVPLTSRDAQPAPSGAASHPFAWEPGWTVYHPRLWFDRNNAMFVTWMWRKEQAGIDTTHPSFAMRPNPQAPFQRADGSSYELPVRLSSVGEIDAFDADHVYHAGTSVTTDARGAPLVVLESNDGTPRTLVTYDSSAKRWRTVERTPYGAPWVVCEDDATCWAYATGPRIFRRKRLETSWKMVYEQDGYCDPKPLHALGAHRRFVHVTRCDWRTSRVIELADQ
ncbi:BNR-4 repeat-containing protein [Steroidobacter flavus]|uniref:BNR-4 repeat-containing protein n=1 Tax=Steroidobacter flavus TaxID=1842136 RepID=A0ABV8SM65_9GAMM